MAPITRRTTAAEVAGLGGKSVTRKPRAPPRQTTENWDLLHRRGSDFDINEEDDEDGEQMTIDNGTSDAQMDSLRDIADRVGKEVESLSLIHI